MKRMSVSGAAILMLPYGRKRNPLDDYMKELESYDKGTPKKIVEMED